MQKVYFLSEITLIEEAYSEGVIPVIFLNSTRKIMNRIIADKL